MKLSFSRMVEERESARCKEERLPDLFYQAASPNIFR